MSGRVTNLNNLILEDLSFTFQYFSESIITSHWGSRLENVALFHCGFY